MSASVEDHSSLVGIFLVEAAPGWVVLGTLAPCLLAWAGEHRTLFQYAGADCRFECSPRQRAFWRYDKVYCGASFDQVYVCYMCSFLASSIR